MSFSVSKNTCLGFFMSHISNAYPFQMFVVEELSCLVLRLFSFIFHVRWDRYTIEIESVETYVWWCKEIISAPREKYHLCNHWFSVFLDSFQFHFTFTFGGWMLECAYMACDRGENYCVIYWWLPLLVRRNTVLFAVISLYTCCVWKIFLLHDCFSSWIC